MPAVTNTNHAAMMSGAFASGSGIARQRLRDLRAARERGLLLPAPGRSNPTVAPTGHQRREPQLPARPVHLRGDQAPGRADAIRRRPASWASRSSAASSPGATSIPERPDADYLWAPCAGGADDDEYCDRALRPTRHRIRAQRRDRDGRGRADRRGRGHGARASCAARASPSSTCPRSTRPVTRSGRRRAYDAAIGRPTARSSGWSTTLQAEGIWDRRCSSLLSDHSMDGGPGQGRHRDGAFDGAGISADDYEAVDGDNGRPSTSTSPTAATRRGTRSWADADGRRSHAGGGHGDLYASRTRTTGAGSHPDQPGEAGVARRRRPAAATSS